MSVLAAPGWMKPHLVAARRHARPLPPAEPSATALLAVDCQNFFLAHEGGSYLPDGADMLPRLATVIDRCRALPCPLVFTAHGHRDPATDGGMLARWWGSAIREGSWEAQVHEALAPRADETVLPKRRYSAFVGTDLESRLRHAGVDTVIIAGVMTNLCCETTARDAFCRDFRVVFLADGTATASGDLHGASLLNLAFGFAHVVTCAELLAWLPEAR